MVGGLNRMKWAVAALLMVLADVCDGPGGGGDNAHLLEKGEDAMSRHIDCVLD